MALTSEKTKYEHVALDDKGVPIIVGTNMKVIEIVLEKTAYGWSPEELYFQHPHLTLGQIYCVLSANLSRRKKMQFFCGRGAMARTAHGIPASR